MNDEGFTACVGYGFYKMVQLFIAVLVVDANAMLDRKDVIRAMYPYIEAHLAQDGKLAYITRHLLGLFNGLPGARQFRRHLSEQAYKKTATLATIEDALALMPDNADELNAIADTVSE